MEAERFDNLLRSLVQTPSRRGALRLLAGLVASLLAVLPAQPGWEAEAKKHKKQQRRRQRKRKAQRHQKRGLGCTPNCPGRVCGPDGCGGSCGSCAAPRLCQGGSCVCPAGTEECTGACLAVCPLNAPVTIEAVWTKTDTDHETYLFVPNAAGSSLPSPFIHDICNPDRSDCETDVYPFACVSQNADGPGGEVTTIRALLPGTYEYWFSVYTEAPAGDLQVRLRDTSGRIVRTWSGPATGSIDELSWHVFDLDGSTGLVTSVDQAVGSGLLPNDAHDPATNVCARR